MIKERHLARLSGFTLVEMVVVLCIISALMAILLPTLKMARAQSRSAVCVSNLRQVGLALENYKTDHGDLIPQQLSDGSERYLSRGAGAGLFETAWAAPVPGSVGDGASFLHYIRDPHVLICPDRRSVGVISYGMNGRVTSRVKLFRNIPEPSETPLILDSTVGYALNYSDMAPRHLGDANILYADSHVVPIHHDPVLGFSAATPLPCFGQSASKDGDTGASYGFELRMAGTHWNSTDYALIEDGNVLGSGTIEREPGSPNEQTVSMGPYWLDPENHAYAMRLSQNYGKSGNGKGGKSQSGGNPLWLSVDGGSWQKLATLNQNKPQAEVDITNMLKK